MSINSPSGDLNEASGLNLIQISEPTRRTSRSGEGLSMKKKKKKAEIGKGKEGKEREEGKEDKRERKRQTKGLNNIFQKLNWTLWPLKRNGKKNESRRMGGAVLVGVSRVVDDKNKRWLHFGVVTRHWYISRYLVCSTDSTLLHSSQ